MKFSYFEQIDDLHVEKTKFSYSEQIDDLAH